MPNELSKLVGSRLVLVKAEYDAPEELSNVRPEKVTCGSALSHVCRLKDWF